MSADIKSCKLVELQLVESSFDAGTAPKDGSRVEIQFKYKVDFGLPEDLADRTFSLKIEAGVKAVSAEKDSTDEFFTAECCYLCTYLAEEGESVELDEYGQFSEELGKRIYLTVRAHLINVLTCGNRNTFLPYELPPKKNNPDGATNM